MSIFAFWPSVTLLHFHIICFFDQVEGVEHESEMKAGTRSSFRHHFGEKLISVFYGFFQVGCHSPYKVHI